MSTTIMANYNVLRSLHTFHSVPNDRLVVNGVNPRPCLISNLTK